MFFPIVIQVPTDPTISENLMKELKSDLQVLRFMITNLTKTYSYSGQFLGEIFLSLSTDSVHDPIFELGEQLGVSISRSSSKYPLERLIKTLEMEPALEHFILVSGDCPLVNPGIINRLMRLHHLFLPDITWMSRSQIPTGLMASAVKYDTMRYLYDYYDSEYPISNFPRRRLRQNPNFYTQRLYLNPMESFSFPNLTLEDFPRIQTVFNKLEGKISIRNLKEFFREDLQ